VGPNRQYRLRRRLAEDDLGSLWLAESTSTGSPSTIRVLANEFATDPFLVRRIGRELAPVFDLLIHPNVALVTNYSLLEDERHVFVAMEALEGRTLRDRLEDADPIPVPDALRLAAEVASGLEAAHRLGIVHGALGPDSVFLTPERAKVIDFGLGVARHWSDGPAALSDPSDRPRALHRHRPLDASSDVAAVADLLSMLVVRRTVEEPGPAQAGAPATAVTEEATSVLPRAVGDVVRMVGDREHRGDVSMAMLAHALRDQTDRPPNVVLDLTRSPREAATSRRHVRPAPVGGHRGQATARHPSAAGRPTAARRPQPPAAVQPEPVPSSPPREATRAVVAQTSAARPSVAGLEEALRTEAAAHDPGPKRHGLRVAAVVAAALVLMASAALAGGLLGDRDAETASPRAEPSVATSAVPSSPGPTPPPAPPATVLVPSVAGLRPFDAVTVLASLGLKVTGAIAVPGEPGLVVDTDPEPGTSVDSGSAVTLLVGAPDDRRSATST
jgi:serine/threonine-protein kinase